MDKLEELQGVHGRVDLSKFDEGDLVEIQYLEFEHEGGAVFTGVKDEERTVSFRINKITHPSGTNVETILWDPTQPNSDPNAVSVNDKRCVNFGPEIVGFAVEVDYKV